MCLGIGLPLPLPLSIYILLLFVFIRSTPIIFRQPPLSAVSNIFILPLDKLVWYSYAALIFCVIFIMGFQMGHPLLEAQITLFDVVSFVTGAVAQQGTNFDIPSLSGRFVLITTFVATLALFTSYSASIVALLQSLSESIHTLDDLLASPLTLALKDTDTTREIFSSNESVLNRIRVKIEPMGKNAWIADEYNGISKVRADLFAFLVDAPSAYNAITRTYTESEKCRLSEIKVFPSPMNTITVAKYSAYKELIKQRYILCTKPSYKMVRTYIHTRTPFILIANTQLIYAIFQFLKEYCGCVKWDWYFKRGWNGCQRNQCAKVMDAILPVLAFAKCIHWFMYTFLVPSFRWQFSVLNSTSIAATSILLKQRGEFLKQKWPSHQGIQKHDIDFCVFFYSFPVLFSLLHAS